MKKWFKTLLFCGIAGASCAQDVPSAHGDTYFFLGAGFSLAKVRDKAHSPQTYKGTVWSLRFGYESLGSEVVSRLAVSFGFGDAAPQAKPKPSRVLSNLEISHFQVVYAHYRILDAFAANGWNRYVGGAFSWTLDLRTYNLPSNNTNGYQNNFSLNVGAFVQKNLDSRWRLNYEAFTPILSYAMRPSYIGMPPITSNDYSVKKIMLTGKIATMNRLFRFYNRFGFDQQVKDFRARRLSYAWDYHYNAVNKAKPLQSIQAGVGYETLFKM